ncbi:MAG: class F sortase [Patescibacteria group bacterium]
MIYHRVFKTVITVLFISSVIGFSFHLQADAAVSVITKPVYVTDNRPRTISIPSIKLNREVIDIGITDEGNLDVPPNFTQVGWYKYGTLPGQVGSTVLDGHVDNGSTVPGPFKRLRNVKIGDKIYVTAADGTKYTYEVISALAYATDSFPSDYVFHDNSDALLKIITCHGKYIESLDTYDQRLIVTAKMVRTVAVR